MGFPLNTHTHWLPSSRRPPLPHLKDAPTHPHLAAHKHTHTGVFAELTTAHSRTNTRAPTTQPLLDSNYPETCRCFPSLPCSKGLLTLTLLRCRYLINNAVNAPASPVSWWRLACCFFLFLVSFFFFLGEIIHNVLSRPNLNTGCGLHCATVLPYLYISFVFGGKIRALHSSPRAVCFKVE